MKLPRTLRTLDDAITGRDGIRHVLVDGRTAVNYEMAAPVVRAMEVDARVQFWFTASEDASRLRDIYTAAPADARLISPSRAALRKWDAYLASDFMWATLPRGTRRVQMFHGVGGKYGFDAPTESMRMWDRLLFVNRRRLRNFVTSGALDPDAPQARLVGMPKVDCLVDGSLRRTTLLDALGLDPLRPTVLYAPTWSPQSSLNRIGLALVQQLRALPINLLVKLHDRSRDLRTRYSGGVDWAARLSPLLTSAHTRLLTDPNITRALAAADVMVTDHSSCGFEYLLLDRPIVRIHVPGLIAGANIHADYVRLLADAAHTVPVSGGAAAVVQAVERALKDPRDLSASRRRVAADLFHEPGHATARCAAALYEVLELEPIAAADRGPAPRAVSTTARVETPPFDTQFRGPTNERPARDTTRTYQWMPTVSVITPAHDVEPFLRDTIESVLAQTFGDWELVIVNDGSRDGTAAIADEYAARDSRVRVIHQENRGLAAARNAALLAGRGQFFALLDGDDTWDPGFLAAQMMVFERHPETALVTGSARLLGGPSHGCLACPEIPGTPVLALDEMIADETAVFIMTVFRRAVVDAIGPFDAAKRRSEDWDFWLRAVAAGFVLRRHWTPLGWYRVRGGSLSQNTAAMLEEMLHTLGKVRRATADTRAQAIADRQIARFERQLLLERAKGALDRGDASQARIQLEALEAQGAGPLIVLTAWLARHAPSAACAAYRLRHLRPRWMRAREPHRVRAGLTT